MILKAKVRIQFCRPRGEQISIEVAEKIKAGTHQYWTSDATSITPASDLGILPSFLKFGSFFF